MSVAGDEFGNFSTKIDTEITEMNKLIAKKATVEELEVAKKAILKEADIENLLSKRSKTRSIIANFIDAHAITTYGINFNGPIIGHLNSTFNCNTGNFMTSLTIDKKPVATLEWVKEQIKNYITMNTLNNKLKNYALNKHRHIYYHYGKKRDVTTGLPYYGPEKY